MFRCLKTIDEMVQSVNGPNKHLKEVLYLFSTMPTSQERAAEGKAAEEEEGEDKAENKTALYLGWRNPETGAVRGCLSRRWR